MPYDSQPSFMIFFAYTGEIERFSRRKPRKGGGRGNEHSRSPLADAAATAHVFCSRMLVPRIGGEGRKKEGKTGYLPAVKALDRCPFIVQLQRRVEHLLPQGVP